MAHCPSTFGLEKHLRDPAAAGLAQHVASCARCREELRLMQWEAEEFRELVYPRTVEAVLDSLERGRKR